MTKKFSFLIIALAIFCSISMVSAAEKVSFKKNASFISIAKQIKGIYEKNKFTYSTNDVSVPPYNSKNELKDTKANNSSFVQWAVYEYALSNNKQGLIDAFGSGKTWTTQEWAKLANEIDSGNTSGYRQYFTVKWIRGADNIDLTSVQTAIDTGDILVYTEGVHHVEIATGGWHGKKCLVYSAGNQASLKKSDETASTHSYLDLTAIISIVGGNDVEETDIITPHSGDQEGTEDEGSGLPKIEIDMTKLKGLPLTVWNKYKEPIKKMAVKYGMDPHIIIAVICVESSGTLDCITYNSAGTDHAFGLMQTYGYYNRTPNHSLTPLSGQKITVNATDDGMRGNAERQIEVGTGDLRRHTVHWNYNVHDGVGGYNKGDTGIKTGWSSFNNGYWRKIREKYFYGGNETWVIKKEGSSYYQIFTNINTYKTRQREVSWPPVFKTSGGIEEADGGSEGSETTPEYGLITTPYGWSTERLIDVEEGRDRDPSISQYGTPTTYGVPTPLDLSEILGVSGELLVSGDYVLSGAQVGMIIANAAKIMYKHKDSFAYNLKKGHWASEHKKKSTNCLWGTSGHYPGPQNSGYRSKFFCDCDCFAHCAIIWPTGIEGAYNTKMSGYKYIRASSLGSKNGEINSVVMNNLRPGDIMFLTGHVAVFYGVDPEKGKTPQLIDMVNYGSPSWSSWTLHENNANYWHSKQLKAIRRPTDTLAKQLDITKMDPLLKTVVW